MSLNVLRHSHTEKKNCWPVLGPSWIPFMLSTSSEDKPCETLEGRVWHTNSLSHTRMVPELTNILFFRWCLMIGTDRKRSSMEDKQTLTPMANTAAAAAAIRTRKTGDVSTPLSGYVNETSILQSCGTACTAGIKKGHPGQGMGTHSQKGQVV